MSVDQSKWHHKTEVSRWVVPSFRFNRSRTLGSLERELDLICRDIAEDLQQIAGIKPNIELVTGVSHSELVSGFSKVRCLNAESKDASIEG